MEAKLRILSTDAKCEDIKGAGFRVTQSDNSYWQWKYIFSDGLDGPIEFGFANKDEAIENIRNFKSDLSNDDLPIYVCVGG